MPPLRLHKQPSPGGFTSFSDPPFLPLGHQHILRAYIYKAISFVFLVRFFLLTSLTNSSEELSAWEISLRPHRLT